MFYWLSVCVGDFYAMYLLAQESREVLTLVSRNFCYVGTLQLEGSLRRYVVSLLLNEASSVGGD